MRFSSTFCLVFVTFVAHASTTLAQLSSGQYVLRSQNGNVPVGRSVFEDQSTRPKKIGVTSDAWNVERLENGRFILRNGGSPTTDINGKVYADVLGQNIIEWVIKRQQKSGAYTIETPDGRRGWVLPSKEVGTQVDSRPLIIGPSLPPFFPLSELWKFDTVADE
ncbi:hypothetical protein CPB84DRAFT_1762892 [Gymnopilus junonius]|uniref:Uncharacterized protein n=1 Tax=Gymnopilus junonius TaxID=109634 RepID=A0A9P5TTH3_GYMJU|nr:hypothetical protein CPB84DRAFT_1762892 [Gymnopilus junonius]